MSIETQPIQFTSIQKISENSERGQLSKWPVYMISRNNGPVVAAFTKDKGKFQNPDACWDAVPALQLAVYAVELEGHGYPQAYEQIKAAIDNAAWGRPIYDEISTGYSARADFRLLLATGKPRDLREYSHELADALMEGALLGLTRMVPKSAAKADTSQLG